MVIAAVGQIPFLCCGLQLGEFDALAKLKRYGSPFALMPTQLYQVAMIDKAAVVRVRNPDLLAFVKS